MMTVKEAVQEIRELTRMKEELEAEIAAAQDVIKAEMTATDNYTIQGTDYKVTWNEVSSTRIDTKALKKALPDVVERFSITSTARRFCIN